MIKLKPLISELTRDQKDRKKDYLFQQAKLTASNTFPTWSEVWKMFKNEGDNLSRGKFGHHQTTVTYEGIIDFHNVDWYGTMFARMNYDLGDMEKEIRFIKNSKIFVTTCDRYSSELDNDNDTGMKRLIINDWRRA